MIERFQLERFKTPLGRMLIVTDAENRLRGVDWPDKPDRMVNWLRDRHGELGCQIRNAPAKSSARRALEAYFDGEVGAIDALRTDAPGTDFQRQVWSALRTIPAGTTISYGELAARIGRPRAVRAVGAANGANPIPIVVPCHRVIGADDSLTGFGGGLERKRWLLVHERTHATAAGPLQS